ncbi:MAG TPA: hypothetical protein VFW33_06040, partial [Gemmataceae bacterium]|nr:hypothetical protein [Gemmataceae bacterium]
MKLAIGAGKGGGVSGTCTCRSGDRAAGGAGFRRAGCWEAGFRCAAFVEGLAGRLPDARLTDAGRRA